MQQQLSRSVPLKRGATVEGQNFCSVGCVVSIQQASGRQVCKMEGFGQRQHACQRVKGKQVGLVFRELQRSVSLVALVPVVNFENCQKRAWKREE